MSIRKAVTAEFDLNGTVGVQVLTASERDLATLAAHLQRPAGRLERSPDIVVEFVPEFSCEAMHTLGLNWAGHTDKDFFLRDARTGDAVARIEFDGIGECCNIAYRSGLASLPLLADVINATFCARGYVSLHASAFHYSGRGVLAAGWEKGGKTEALLAFAAHGARFVGDEMMLLSSDGRRMLGVPLPISVWDWQARQLHGVVPKGKAGHRIVSGGIGLLDSLNQRLQRTRVQDWRPFRMLDKSIPTLKRQQRSWHWPGEMFPAPLYAGDTDIDTVLLMTTHADESISVEPCDSRRFAASMAASNAFERTHLMQYYRAFRFAFPDRRCPLLDSMESTQSAALSAAIDDRPVYEVRHPYPVSLQTLYEAIRPVIVGGAG